MNLERNLQFQQKYFRHLFDSYQPENLGTDTQSASRRNTVVGDRILILTDNPQEVLGLFPELGPSEHKSIVIFKGTQFSRRLVGEHEVEYTLNHPYILGNLFIKITDAIAQSDLGSAEAIFVYKKLSMLENKKLERYRFKTEEISSIDKLKELLSYVVTRHKPLELEPSSVANVDRLNFGLDLNISLKVISGIIEDINNLESANPYSQTNVEDVNNIILNHTELEFKNIGTAWIRESMSKDFYANCYIVEQLLRTLELFKKEILSGLDRYSNEVIAIVTGARTQSDIYSALLKTSIVEVDKIAMSYLSDMKVSY